MNDIKASFVAADMAEFRKRAVWVCVLIGGTLLGLTAPIVFGGIYRNTFPAKEPVKYVPHWYSVKMVAEGLEFRMYEVVDYRGETHHIVVGEPGRGISISR